MKAHSGWYPGVIVLIGLVVVSLLDYLTGERLDFSVFYFIPLYWAARSGSRPRAIAASVLCAVGWMTVDLLTDPAESIALEVWDTLFRLAAFLFFAVTLHRLRADWTRERSLNDQLNAALAQVKQLSGILPMCSICRRIRDDAQNWVRLERYIQDHSEARVSHGLCPECYKKYYGEENGT